ncbi:MAG: hypothetical protein RL308_3387, partial [Bacteroidota bacterium]
MDIEILGESPTQSGYTVYRNNDKEMVEKIKNIKLSDGVFSGYILGTFYKNAKLHQVLNDTQNLYVDENNKYVIANESIIFKLREQDLLKEINSRFSVADALNYTFDNLLNRQGFKYCFYQREGVEYNSMCAVYTDTNGYEIFGDNDYIAITEKDSSGSMFAYLNIDGNIENRDYNLNITKLLENKVSTNKQQFFNDLISRIPIGNYKNYGNKYFKDGVAYVLDFEPYRSLFQINICKGDNGKYRNSYLKSFTAPKKLIDVTEKDMIFKILSFLNPLNIGGDESLIDLSLYETNKIYDKLEKPIVDKSKYSELYVIIKEDISEEMIELIKGIDIPDNEEKLQEYLLDIMSDFDLPNFNFDSYSSQEDHQDFIGLVELQGYGIYYSFNVEQGDCIEARWDGTIFET